MEMNPRTGNSLPRIQMLVLILCLLTYATAFLEVSGLVSSVARKGFAHGELHDHDSSTQRTRKYFSRSLLQDNSRDAVALLEFKDGISRDAKGALDGWNSGNFSSYCSWTGVTCDIDQLHVVSIRLPDLLLNGSLSVALANLSYLEELDLSHNYLESKIPPELGQLGNLRILNLENNRLFGEIPLEFGNLTNLQELNLGGEGYWFNGSIPEELGLLTELEILNLGTLNNLQLDKLNDYHNIPSNRLKGPLPRSLGNCTKLRYLDFYGSFFLSGSIPEEYGQFINLNYLSFEQNNLTGFVPKQLGNLTKLWFLHFGNNGFQGRLPAELAQLSDLILLNVGTNSFTGNFIEVNSTSWSILIWLFLDGNLFDGKFPEFLTTIRSLEILYMNNNNFTGELPNSLNNLKNLTSLVLRNNQFEGQIPEGLNLTFLRRMDLSNNRLNGTLHALTNSKALTYLNVGISSSSKSSTWESLRGRNSDPLTNSFSGDITDDMVSQWPSLVYLYLDTNSFSGPIPRALVNLTHLKHLFLNNNQFSGTIPGELGQLQNLTLLWLQDNKLVGNIPEGLGNLNLATEINLGNNTLTGYIPAVFGNLNELQHLRLHQNNLTGEIPRELTRLQKLIYLILYENKLEGQIPVDIANCSALENVRLSYNLLRGELAHIDFRQLPTLKSFSVNGNKLDGDFPSRILQCTQLELLDLSENQLSGGIPTEAAFTHHLPSLRVLSLSSNNLTGAIPAWIWNLTALQVLDLSFNGFSGQFPDELSGLQSFNVSQNDSRIPATQAQSKTRLFEQISIRAKGNTLVYVYVLETLTSLDTSSNLLSGELPQELGSLQGLMFLNLANNSLGGNITTVGNLPLLDSLDLSMNEFSGLIPPLLGRSTLGYLNLSLNNLSGPIPDKFSFSTRFKNNSFWPGNPDLCGIVLDKPCPATPPQSPDTSPPTTSTFVNGTFRIAAGTGFVVGFFVVFAPLLLIGELRRKFYLAGPLAGPRDYGLYQEPR